MPLVSLLSNLYALDKDWTVDVLADVTLFHYVVIQRSYPEYDIPGSDLYEFFSFFMLYSQYHVLRAGLAYIIQNELACEVNCIVDSCMNTWSYYLPNAN